jgi:hypothetical protein
MANLALSEYLRSALSVVQTLGVRNEGQWEQNHCSVQDPRQFHHAFLRFTGLPPAATLRYVANVP